MNMIVGLDMDTNIVNTKICFSRMMLTPTKQHLSNIWSSIHEKFINNEAELKKKRCL